MSSPGFTPSNVIDMSKERDWPANLGMLDWDTTHIIFTKRSLLEFLKYAGVTVDTNLTSIQKLPKYARFGTIAGVEESSDAKASIPADTTTSESGSAAFRPSRRVRTAPGGKHTDIFGTDDDDVLASAPPRGEVEAPQAVVDSKVDLQPTTEEKPTAAVYETAQEARPKSKRTTSSVASLWDAHDSPDQFKPTRR
ncbi:hypothetical protein AcW1_005454 [Taiwanofungus camphoratus]|nr:hypothetical protein AcW2_004219 [Antrodia cinnamomea]KAI0933692.1 hypothetical protein AcV5_005776 [Antrodia cinnamomea]KAI0948518.1 hypothetical protein AcV7_009236 [Antrodia cinnamomea]KAI0956878.1 hypothetical protein AcW1_005454 [Antrodia cinnamomea]